MLFFIKLLSLAYITIIEIMFAFLIAISIDTGIYKTVQDDQHQSTPTLLLETAFFIGLVVVLTFILKQLFKLLPFPFVGLYGFKKNTLREPQTLTTMTVFAIFFCNSIQYKISILKKRFLLFDNHI